MSRFRSLPRRSMILFALAIGAVAALLVLAAPQRAAAFLCGPGGHTSANITYYSSPQHDEKVGEFFGCTQDLIGEQTAYYTGQLVCCSGD